MFKIHLAKIHKEDNPNFHLEGEWRYSKGGMSELCEGDIIMVETGEYYYVREKVWQGAIQLVKIQLLDDEKYQEQRYLGLQEKYKMISNVVGEF